jgi:predicted PurR-regulated permease PerM
VININKEYKIPFYIKAILYILGLYTFFMMLDISQSIIVPIIFAIIIAIVLHPVVNFLVRLRINRLFAIIITMTLSFVAIAALGTLIISQAMSFSDSWPILVERFTAILNQSISWVAGYFDINPTKIHEWIANSKGDLMGNSSAVIGKTLISIGGGLVALFLMPVYVFMILFYEPLLLDFIRKLFGTDNRSKVSEIIAQTKSVIQRYLVGLVIEAIIIAILYTLTLWFLGIEYALLLGIIGALLNVIPYVGGIVGVGLPMMVAIATKDTAWYAVYILIIFYIIQLIDNNYIVPKIVASKVKINALFSIIVVIAGNALWGIPGMFLSIPLLAIVKLIFDHIEPLKPWGFLLGDTMPSLLTIKPILKKIIKKAK